MRFPVPSAERLHGCGVVFQPGIERGLRLLEKDAGIWKTRLPRRFQRELLRCGIERGWNRDGHLLRRKRSPGMGIIPSRGESLQKKRQRLHRTDQIAIGKITRTQGKKLRTPVCRMMHEPGLCGMDYAPRHLRSSRAGEATYDPASSLLRREIQKRGKRRVRACRVGRLGLRNQKDIADTGCRTARHGCQSAIRRSQINTDSK